VELSALNAAPVRRGDRRLLIVRDANGQALAYVYFEDESDRRAAAKLLPALLRKS
jgi:putative heme degradation protein